MHLVTHENYGDATDAIRDILLIYVAMADDYSGFGHASDAGSRFDPLRFIDAEDDRKAHYVDMQLLREGSAVAILCWYYDLWSEGQALRGQRFEAALNEGRFAAFPDIEAVLREALIRDTMPMDDPWFEAAAAPIYTKYVRGYFQRLAANDRNAP